MQCADRVDACAAKPTCSLDCRLPRFLSLLQHGPDAETVSRLRLVLSPDVRNMLGLLMSVSASSEDLRRAPNQTKEGF